MKIVVSDYDNIVSKKNFIDIIDSINKFVRDGNMFIIATNKAMNYLADDLSMVDLDCEYYICNSGAVIFDRYFNVIYRKDIKQELVRPIYNYLKDDENILETFIDTSHGFVFDTSKSANGIIARPFDSAKGELALDYISRKFPDVHGNVNDNLINIVDKKVSKSFALDYLVNTYNYNKEDVTAIGTTLNDYSLLEKYNGYTLVDSINDLKSISLGTAKDLIEVLDRLSIKLVDPNNEFEFED
jgi:Predicted hydrolases of the HAD superfamily